MADDPHSLAERLAQFQDEAARYFEKRPTNGEDQAHWANVYNAENCRKTAALLPKPLQLRRREVQQPILGTPGKKGLTG